jgi:hypothetical protein
MGAGRYSPCLEHPPGRIHRHHSRLRPHPGRILIVFGAPIAFAITGFLHDLSICELAVAIY